MPAKGATDQYSPTDRFEKQSCGGGGYSRGTFAVACELLPMVQEGAFPTQPSNRNGARRRTKIGRAQESHSLDEFHHQLTTAHMPRNGHQQNTQSGGSSSNYFGIENGLSPVLRPDGYAPRLPLRLQQFAGVTEAVNDKRAWRSWRRMGRYSYAPIKATQLLASRTMHCSPPSAAAATSRTGLAVHGTYHAAWGAIVASGGLKRMIATTSISRAA